MRLRCNLGGGLAVAWPSDQYATSGWSFPAARKKTKIKKIKRTWVSDFDSLLRAPFKGGSHSRSKPRLNDDEARGSGTY